MAPVKKKVLRFKNTPVKKETPFVKKVTKKKEVILPQQTTDMIAQNTIITEKKEIITPIETPVVAEKIPLVETKVIEKTEKTISASTIKLLTTSDPVLVSAREKEASSDNLFPRISRIITEKWFLIGLVCGMLVVAIYIVSINIQENIHERKLLEQKRLTIQQQITYWQETARKYPGYRDAYFQLALLEYQLGNIQSSQSYLNKVESLDPNFQEAYKLEKVLKGN